MNAEQEIQQLRGRIAEVFARREHLKQALEHGAVALRAGFQQLEHTDRELSDLDGRFKALWDTAHARNKEATP
jgi:chromosome segregation ATPase